MAVNNRERVCKGPNLWMTRLALFVEQELVPAPWA